MANRKSETLLQRIADVNDHLSPKQSKIAQYVVKNYQKLAYCTLSELAQASKISDTTILRLVSALGYGGFPDFMFALRKEIEKNTHTNRIMGKFELKQEKYKFPEDTCQAIFDLEMQVLKETLAKADKEKHSTAVDLLLQAPSVTIVGFGANTCCSQALAYGLQVMRPNVKIIEQISATEGNTIQDVPEASACVAFSTPRYPKDTQFILEKIRQQRQTKIIGLSDSILSPIAPLCDIFFEIPIKYVTFSDPNAAFMAMIHSLLFGLYLRDPKNIKKRIKDYDSYTKEREYYLNDSLNLVEF